MVSFFWIQLEKRDELAKFLLENDVYTTFRYWPINKIPYFKLNNFALSSSDWASEHTLNLPIHQSLSFQDLATLNGSFSAAAKPIFASK